MHKTMNWRMVWGLAGLMLCGCLSPRVESAKRPKAIMFMLDGLRADALEQADAPNIRSLRDGTWQPGYRGLWSRNGRTVPDADPSSAANHATLATGVTAKKHGVFKNDTTAGGRFDQWPTFLARVVDAIPDTKGFFAYAWGENADLGRHPRVKFLGQPDEANGIAVPKVMAAPDAPDVVLYFINLPDHFGHWTTFYPFGYDYLHAIHQADQYIGEVLKAISSRPTFADEDWLIAVTGDHGGYLTAHGMWGGHATTVPLVAAGRHLPAGRIPGAPFHYDLTATILDHFGLDPVACGLDGRVLTAIPVAAPRPVSEGLVAFLPFDGSITNVIAKGPMARPFGEVQRLPKAFLGEGLHLSGGTNVIGGVRLEGSERAFGPQGTFAMTFWARLPKAQRGDPVLVGNKDWLNGANPGFALTAARPTPGYLRYWAGPAFNCGTHGEVKRLDLSAYQIEPGAWTFYAVVRDAEGVISFYQGRADGRFHWISDDGSDMTLESGMPLVLGQDGTGRYGFGLDGDLDEFALWERPLTHDEVKRIYEAGRLGLGLADLTGEVEVN